MNIALPCEINYVKFPFDTIVCHMLITTWVPPNFSSVRLKDKISVSQTVNTARETKLKLYERERVRHIPN